IVIGTCSIAANEINFAMKWVEEMSMYALATSYKDCFPIENTDATKMAREVHSKNMNIHELSEMTLYFKELHTYMWMSGLRDI
ncbi:hypothetical protein ACJX0J_035190, partial [Zea mays]